MMFGQCPWCGGSVGYGVSFWGVGFTLLFGLLVLVGIVLLIVWAVRSSSGHSTGQMPASDAALDAARRRYATGEITKEQFEEIRKNLGPF